MTSSGRLPDRIRWQDLAKLLETRSHGELLGLLRALFELGIENRVFLATQLVPEHTRLELLAHYGQIVEQTTRSAGRQRGAAVRGVLRAYVNASGDRIGAARLLLQQLRERLQDMRGSGARRPAGGFAALLGDLARWCDQEPELRQALEEELAALYRQAAAVDEDLAEAIAARLGAAQNQPSR